MSHLEVRVVDADQPRSADRRLVQVAVGVLLRADNAFLLTSRPEGKAYAGYWEFPGGKLEAGETVEQALRRELQEEIGITIQDCTVWKTERIDYPHALVQLNFCQVTQWTGELQMLESQSFAWQQLPVDVKPVLPGTLPVLQWFAQERNFTGATHSD
ncbi:7,8-dihydro-8-oxoguanine-triphosphatase [Limnohabitans sp. MORI2]|jgi:8-oxo-dGTP diphosphatase|uniref:8-oxo-dGTP diphosphatase MutT n=1 Tax=Limnohabitans sp. MORI2 TaxID=1751150 RepID=UPI002377AB7B|nr:8-oxo-dGTP diphosphatase MutT [Limnohabitans sp. MORI2]BDU59157.1 7,8-dihydro-8-oxoguanine-triphosphatase [Limnohabitans sp. MORI2]